MASKRKRSRPTKLPDSYQSFAEDDYVPEEDSTTRIQRFLDYESEDTPESNHIAIKQMPFTNIFGSCEKLFAGAMSSVEEQTPTSSFDNGCIQVSLKFPQPTDGRQHAIQNEAISQTVAGGWPVISDKTANFERPTTTSIQKDENIRNPQENENLSPGSQKTEKPCTKRAPRTRDSLEYPRYACDTCKYVTNRSDHFKRHLMTHSEDKPLKCTMCNYGTGRSDHYKRHLQRHGMSDAAIIECCARLGLKLKSSSLTPVEESKDKKENGQTSTKALKAIRPGRPYSRTWKKYICDSCGYATDKSSHYNRHIRTHSEDRPHVCKMCNKSFKMPLYLNKHRCSKLFRRRCDVCNCIFIDRNALLEHMAGFHPDMPVPPDVEILEDKKDEEAGTDETNEKQMKPPPVEEQKFPGLGNTRDNNSFFSNFTKMASEIIRNNIMPEKGSSDAIDFISNGDADDAGETVVNSAIPKQDLALKESVHAVETLTVNEDSGDLGWPTAAVEDEDCQGHPLAAIENGECQGYPSVAAGVGDSKGCSSESERDDGHADENGPEPTVPAQIGTEVKELEVHDVRGLV